LKVYGLNSLTETLTFNPKLLNPLEVKCPGVRIIGHHTEG